MYVVKRDGRKEAVKFDKITARIVKMCYGLDPLVSPEMIAMKVIEGLYDGVKTTDLDNLAAEVAASKTLDHPDYALLASRIAVSNMHKNTKKVFSEVVDDLYNYIDPKTNKKASLIADDVYEVVQKHKAQLDSSVIYDRDFKYDYFGFKTLERSYLLRINGLVAERPQHIRKARTPARQIGIREIGAGAILAEPSQCEMAGARPCCVAVHRQVRNVQPAARRAAQFTTHRIPRELAPRRVVVLQVRRHAQIRR